jgi:muramoyltetrapeptide carboxypeptidase
VAARVVLPPALKRGDAVAIVSPSWGGPAAIPAPYRRGLAALEAAGHRVKVMSNCEGMHNGWLSGTAGERADDLHAAFADPEVRGIICSIGGDHSAQVLPLLDMELVRANPTVFCGYSDITSLHHGIHAATDLVTFYGPAVIPQWGAVGGVLPYVLDHFRRVTGVPSPSGPLPRADFQIQDDRFDEAERTGTPLLREPSAPREVLRPGPSARGPLLAACLPSARNVLATNWQPDYRGRVLILETPEPPYGLPQADADLTHLRMAGCFDDLAALVLCRPYRFSPDDVTALHELVLDHVARFAYPVLAMVEGGHTDPLPTFPIGAEATVAGDELILGAAVVG